VAAPQVAGLGAMADPDVTSDDGVLLGVSLIIGAPLRQSPRWGFWATILWALVIAAIYAAAQFGIILAVADWRSADLTDSSSFDQLMISGSSGGYVFSLANLVTTIICCASIAAIIRLKKHAVVREYLCLKPVTLTAALKWIGLFVVLQVGITLILTWFDLSIDDDFIAKIYKAANPVWMLWLVLVVAIPLLEEIFFRGFLLTGFAASFMRPSGAVIVTTGLWAALHTQYDVVGLADVFCLGLVFGAARIRTGSLIVPLGLHMFQNLFATILTAIAN
jgi:membrane protease YdiL (CAAX protease family)